MTDQEVKEIIYTKFIGKAMHEGSSYRCTYKNEKGEKCAVGLFIPDGHPAQDAFATGVLQLLEMYPDLIPLMPLEKEGLHQMQRLHDSDVTFINAPLEIQREMLFNEYLIQKRREEHERSIQKGSIIYNA